MIGTAIGLAVLGFLAIIVEFFVPAAGIIGILGAGCVVAGVVLTFMHAGSLTGMIFLLAVLFIGPVIMFLYFKFFPKSFIGRRLILGRPETDIRTIDKTIPDPMLGKTGKSLTDLRPSGMALIGNTKISVVSSGEYIEPDTPISVVKVEGTRIIVRGLK